MAAGLGFKTFTTGEVLTAGDVNGYLMQGINVFATTTARNAAITAPAEGQFAFTKDTNSLWYYDGAAWVASGATGDIEGVTAGVGISGGGTSGTVTVTNSMATAIDAKGDLVPGTGADTFARLAVGANGTVLTADSAEATGLKWATAASGGGWTSLASGTLSSNATTVSITTTGYQQLVCIQKDVVCTTDWYWNLRINGDGGSNYRSTGVAQTSTSAAAAYTSTYTGWVANQPNEAADRNCYAIWTIMSPAGTDTGKVVSASFGAKENADGYFNAQSLTGFYHGGVSAITSVTFFPDSTYSSGTYEIYGVK